MIYLAARGEGILVSRQEVAAQAAIPSQFLAKIAQDLAKAGFIEIRQGAKGGFRLQRPAEEISLLEVVEAIIGEIYLNDCVVRPGSCQVTYSCAVHKIWLQARDQLRGLLGGVSLAQLARDESCMPLFQPAMLQPAGNGSSAGMLETVGQETKEREEEKG